MGKPAKARNAVALATPAPTTQVASADPAAAPPLELDDGTSVAPAPPLPPAPVATAAKPRGKSPRTAEAAKPATARATAAALLH
jgi:hypothetical protein